MRPVPHSSRPGASAPASTVLDVGDFVDRGQFVVTRLLGRGGMAEVYEINDTSRGTAQALKVPKQLHVGHPRRVAKEHLHQRRVDHPNVVRSLGTSGVRGRLCLRLERVRGADLAWVLSAGALGLAEVDLLFRGVLAGVAAIHRSGLVHRDLKPANIVVDAVRAVPRVTDFGLAHDPQRDPWRYDAPVQGTWAYMAPEQLDRAIPDPRGDVFALGSLLFELLTGRAPFRAPSVTGTVRRLSRGEVPRLPRTLPLHARFGDVVHAALAPDPADRPADAAELLDLWLHRAPPLQPLAASTLVARLARVLPPQALPTSNAQPDDDTMRCSTL